MFGPLCLGQVTALQGNISSVPAERVTATPARAGLNHVAVVAMVGNSAFNVFAQTVSHKLAEQPWRNGAQCADSCVSHQAVSVGMLAMQGPYK